jgi:hypothetical protein
MTTKAEIYNEKDELINTFEGVNLIPIKDGSSIFANSSSQRPVLYYNLKPGHYIKNILTSITK